jgi:hypothetical protein
MKLTDDEYNLLYKKLEYRFKNSGNDLVDKIKNKEDLSNDDIQMLLKKLEYTFRKSDNELIYKLSKLAGLEDYVPIKYGNIKAKKKKDIRERENLIYKFKEFKENKYISEEQ